MSWAARPSARRRLHLPGRLHRQHLRRSNPDRSRFRLRRLWPSDGLGRRVQDSCRYAPTPTPHETLPRLWPLAHRASACAAPSTCSLRATRIKAMREMIRLQDRGAETALLWLNCSRCSRATSRRSTRRWRACRSPSASWIRRSTSSFRTPRKKSKSSAEDMRHFRRGNPQAIIDSPA